MGVVPPILDLPLELVRPIAEEVHFTIDPTLPTFIGAAEITMHADSPVKRVSLHSKNLVIHSIRVDGQPARGFKLDDEQQVLRIDLPGSFSGDFRVMIDYTGTVNTVETTGIFSQDEMGLRYFFTQFESIDARAAMPCVDQPGSKIPWTIGVDAPSDWAIVGNMPVAREDADGGRKDVWFAPTPALPAYLVAFAAGPFDSVEIPPAGQNQVTGRVYVPSGRLGDVGDAPQAYSRLLARMESHIGVPFPYAKLDYVTIPQTVGFGAMENAGLITVELDYVLPPADGPDEQFLIGRDTFAGHEIAHQWFGDYVTPTSWTDIWLNESFASYWEVVLVRPEHPTIDIDTVEYRGSPLSSDGLDSARAIQQPVLTPDDAENAFDPITYIKGQAVLDMIAGYVGAERFEAALGVYLREHPHGSATHDDLYAVLGRELGPDAVRIFEAFVERPGVPVVDATLECDGPALSLEQRRWSVGQVEDSEPWPIPVCVAYPQEGNPNAQQCALMDQATLEIPLPVQHCDVVHVNVGQRGYFLTHYTQPHVLQNLMDGKAVLTPAERIGVLSDAAELVRSGDMQPNELLRYIPQIAASGDSASIGSTVDLVAALDEQIPEASRPAYAAFVRKTYGPALAELGMRPIGGEDTRSAELRVALIGLLGDSGEDPQVIEAAKATARAFVDGSGSVPTDTRGALLRVAAQHGDPELFDGLIRIGTTAEDRDVRLAALSALGSFQDADRLRSALDLALDEDTDIREMVGLYRAAFGDRRNRPIAWAWLEQNVDPLSKRVPGIARAYLIYMAGGFCDEGDAEKAERLFGKRAKRWIGGKRVLAQTLEDIRSCAARKEATQADVAAFLDGMAQ